MFFLRHSVESTQQEVDTRVILHSVYSVQHEGVDRVIIRANDIDIIVACIYYAATLLRDLPEMWVRTAQSSYLPIHEMASALGPTQSRALPFIHSLSGRDITSYLFFTGKKTWLTRSKEVDIAALEDFGDPDESPPYTITAEVTSQARVALVAVYTKKNDDFEGSGLDELRVHRFLNNKSTLLKLLPPTEDAFLLHVKRAALATLMNKASHIARPELGPYEDYGWSQADDKLSPVPSTKPAWPEQMTKNIFCGCTKGSNRNCSCNKKGIPCYIGCRCQGSPHKCSRTRCAATFDDSDTSSDSDGQ